MTALFLLLVASALCQVGCTLVVGADIQRRLQHLANRTYKMDQAETQAFADLNTKVDAIVALVQNEKVALDAALASNDSAGIVAAATALSAKLDAALAPAPVA